MRWAYGRVRVAGPSMVPALRDGDRLLVRWRARWVAGDLVVARLPGSRGALVVKRAQRPVTAGEWLLTSDNPFVPAGSRVLRVPAADVVGRVLLRYAPLPPLPAARLRAR